MIREVRLDLRGLALDNNDGEGGGEGDFVYLNVMLGNRVILRTTMDRCGLEETLSVAVDLMDAEKRGEVQEVLPTAAPDSREWWQKYDFCPGCGGDVLSYNVDKNLLRCTARGCGWDSLKAAQKEARERLEEETRMAEVEAVLRNPINRECLNCSGSGVSTIDPCPLCGGSGRMVFSSGQTLRYYVFRNYAEKRNPTGRGPLCPECAGEDKNCPLCLAFATDPERWYDLYIANARIMDLAKRDKDAVLCSSCFASVLVPSAEIGVLSCPGCHRREIVGDGIRVVLEDKEGPLGPPMRCASCDGKGEIPTNAASIECSKCRGSGMVVLFPCRECSSTGRARVLSSYTGEEETEKCSFCEGRGNRIAPYTGKASVV